MRRINGKKRKRKRLLAGIPFFLQSKTSYQGKKIERSGGEGGGILRCSARKVRRERRLGGGGVS